MSYDDVSKCGDLNDYLNPSLEVMVETVIMDSEGLSNTAVKNSVRDRWGAVISVSDVHKSILDINRKYSDEIGSVMIVFNDGLWRWKGDLQ